MHRDESTLLGLERGGCDAGLGFRYQAEHIAGTAEGEGETRATLPVRVDDAAERPIRLLPELAFDPDILTADRAETLDDGRVGIELGILESGNKAVAPRAHPFHFWAL